MIVAIYTTISINAVKNITNKIVIIARIQYLFVNKESKGKDEYKKGNKLCVKVWNDYNLGKYTKDEGFRIGDYNEPVK